MPILIAPTLPKAEVALRRGLRALMGVSSSARRDLAKTTNAEGLTFSLPHPVYTAGLGDLLLHEAFAPKLSGWRYLILRGDEIIGRASVEYDPSEEVARFAGWNASQTVKSIVRAVTVAEDLPQVRESDYELRLLSVPGLYLVALWLHGELDILIPLPPAPRNVEAFESHSIDELRYRMHEAAALRLTSEKDSFDE